MTQPPDPTDRYRCPGEDHPISRAVHLGRLASFYPGCRQCRHRDDTGTLSVRQVEQLAETRPRGRPRPLFDDEGAGGVYLNDLGPAEARRMAAALGVSLQRQLAAGGAADPPVVALAGDGRPISCQLVAAVGEGLRWAGCHVVDVGAASAACLAFAVGHLKTGAGILVGNPAGQPHTAALRFWGAGARPMSAGGSLEHLAETYRAGVDRPTRAYGSPRRFRAEAPYLASLSEYYHALRPLRLVLECPCRPLAGYLEKLTDPVGCRVIPRRTTADELPRQIIEEEAHFAARVDGDGEVCRVLDEQGQRVPDERFLLLICRHLLTRRGEGAVVLEAETPPEIASAIAAAGGRTQNVGNRREQMAAAMIRQGGLFGGGPSGRFWYTAAGTPLPDALTTLTLLLVLLSRDDRPLSEVLDHEAVVG